ncbi:geranylgeranyl reductase family protein [Methanococcoides alaskense]|uniref:Geranylgeranyl reductase family protein n=1 Tax=Methanococcoides alaskense TaxID=325778 RepID=A0AA90TXI6_9EURY|nr:NAD(P)/FAD-dependent oxidoreductase [Methanococcoides alaskense]MDA0525319.1 NAD(P)/FAD-dependent oxidoreductase [Methanococcoides alaskense]MDR6221755.1 geranylgeranyl reductase family protein [Methanococcoides alaskense]
MIYDVVVVGAGPTGSTAARYAAMAGAKVLIIEEHASIGSPVECTGLLSTRAVSECDVRPEDDFVLNSVRGAFVHSPDGTCLPIDGKRTKAYVVSRKIFDRHLVSLAVDTGAELMLKGRVTGIQQKDGIQLLSVIHMGKMITVRSKIIIGADGVKSNVARYTGLGKVDRILSGVQTEALYNSNDTDFVELFVGSQAPGFFAWTVPVNERISRIGLAVEPGNEHNAINYLRNIVNKNERLAGNCTSSMLDLVVGGIPIGPLKRTYSDGVLIAGDAAGQVKPTSGGGIYTGAVCAKIAGQVAAEAVSEENLSANRLKEYESRWKAALGRELRTGMRIHDFMGGLTDKELDDLIGSMNNNAILELITKYGDMDHPSILIKKLLNPMNSRHLIGVFRAFAKAVL